MQRRALLCSLGATLVPQAVNATDRLVEVWVNLSLPELASLPREQVQRIDALRQRIQLQQQQVMSALLVLGATELGRVQLLRNALVVRLPASQLAAAQALPQVRSVQVIRHLDRQPPRPISRG